jgi:hypothetical protein
LASWSPTNLVVAFSLTSALFSGTSRTHLQVRQLRRWWNSSSSSRKWRVLSASRLPACPADRSIWHPALHPTLR